MDRRRKYVEGIAGVVAFLAAIAIEQYCERWFIVTTPSGLRETYHGPASYILSLLIFLTVAFATFKLLVRILSR